MSLDNDELDELVIEYWELMPWWERTIRRRYLRWLRELKKK